MGWRGHPECLHIFSPPQSLTQILLLSFQRIHNCHFDRREGRFCWPGAEKSILWFSLHSKLIGGRQSVCERNRGEFPQLVARNFRNLVANFRNALQQTCSTRYSP
jgi:hypothetical protein